MRRILLIGLMLWFQSSIACSIFTSSRNGKVLVGANEDGAYPFTYVRFQPPTKNTYGAVFFGYSDMQAQAGMNEHGLFFDYAAIPKISLDKPQGPIHCQGFSDLLYSCKTVDDVLEKLKDRSFNIRTTQVLIADAQGNSITINAQGFVEREKDYQIITNFNACTIKDENYSCLRYEKIDKALSSSTPLSVDFFQSILEDVHQEGNITTQYSNVYDLKDKKIYLNLYHNFKVTHEIDLTQELEKGSRIVPFDRLFNTFNFATLNNRSYHPDYFRETMLNDFEAKGFAAGLKTFETFLKTFPEKKENIYAALNQVPFPLMARARIQHDNQPLFYYYLEQLDHCQAIWESQHDNLKTAKAIFEYLDNEDLVTDTFSFNEDKGYLHLVLGEAALSKTHLNRALALTKDDAIWQRKRINHLLGAIE
ncbi:MAG: carcinine hydrolase/isopenicillin-N N-acyltransferase family protein [Bacteroidota bacterium]